MRIPIRIIGVATSIFWVFLIIFSASAIYSMKDFQFNLGQPEISTTEDYELLFSFPVLVANTGFYNIAHFNISTTILNEEGSAVAQGLTFTPILGHGQTTNVTHNMRLNVTYLLQTQQSLLLNDSELTGTIRISMRVAEAVPVEASSNLSIPWGAPLYGLVLDVPQFTSLNATHSQVIIPMNFENHALFNLTGTVQTRAFSGSTVLISENQTDIYAPQHSPYHGNLELCIPVEATGVRFEAFFSTQFFNYGPLVIPYGY